MSKLLDFFSYGYSRFNYSKAKEATARISLYNELKIANVFTMEASFLGPDSGEYQNKHFNNDLLGKAGKTLLEALIVHESIDIRAEIKK
jgi:hypothetical protein